jgi:hypothetical protein
MHWKTILLVPLIFLSATGRADEHRPGDYIVKQISSEPIFNQSPLINRDGDVVWGGAGPASSDLFVYERQTAKVSKLGNGNLWFGSYQINRRGDVVWVESGITAGLYLYRAQSLTTSRLADAPDMFAGFPQLSDRGDVVWVGQLGAESGVLRYDAASGQTAALAYTGATRPGYPRINARGDIAWLASVGDHTQILLYTAADGSIVDLSQPDRDDYGNQQINDRGDVLWNGSDGHDSEIYLYQGLTRKVTQLTVNDNDDDFMELGARGDAVWVESRSDGYVITLYRAATASTAEIATETRFVSPLINARADLVWRSTGAGVFLTKRYDGATGTITALTSTPGSGAFDLDLADNGDVVWSLPGGLDFEVYTYQARSRVTTVLTRNTADDGFTVINALGDVAWMQFNPGDAQIMLALKRARAMH